MANRGQGKRLSEEECTLMFERFHALKATGYTTKDAYKKLQDEFAVDWRTPGRIIDKLSKLEKDRCREQTVADLRANKPIDYSGYQRRAVENMIDALYGDRELKASEWQVTKFILSQNPKGKATPEPELPE